MKFVFFSFTSSVSFSQSQANDLNHKVCHCTRQQTPTQNGWIPKCDPTASKQQKSLRRLSIQVLQDSNNVFLYHKKKVRKVKKKKKKKKKKPSSQIFHTYFSVNNKASCMLRSTMQCFRALIPSFSFQSPAIITGES